jgi:hypothetical protein
MKYCDNCGEAYPDSIKLVNPTIYVIEGNYYNLDGCSIEDHEFFHRETQPPPQEIDF